MGNLLVAIIFIVIGILFGGIGISAYKSNKVVSFWNVGNPVNEKDICDKRNYNKSYGKLFIGFSLAWIIAGVISMFKLSVIFILLMPIVSIVFLVIGYQLIYSKHKVKH